MKSLISVVVGDSGVGKTSLIIRYAKDDFLTSHKFTVFDYHVISVPIRGETYEVNLYDTAGQEYYDQIRRMSVKKANVLLICFAVNSLPSFKNVRDLWVPEVRQYCPEVPYILVGTKIDLRSDQNTVKNLAADGESLITKRQGQNLAAELKAVKYVECSALTKENLKDILQDAIIIASFSDNGSLTTIVKHQPTSASHNTSSNINYNRNSYNNKTSSTTCCRDCLMCIRDIMLCLSPFMK